MAVGMPWALSSAPKGRSYTADHWQKVQDQVDTLGISSPWFLEEEAKMREKQQREHEGQRKGEEVLHMGAHAAGQQPMEDAQ